MKYAFGNMLNGAGGLNADQLALDLQFATDKTLTARRGPTPVFSRGSTGTFVGSNGLIQSAAINTPRFDHDPVTLASRGLLIEEQRQNLYQRSENFADVFWTKTRSSIQSDATTAPDGTTTADKLIEDTTASSTHTIGSIVTPTATPHTLSVFAKKGERNFIVLRLGGLNDFFNLDTGVAITNLNSPTITNYGNGWYRCTVTSSAGTQGSFQMSSDGITTSYTGDGTSGVFIWGAQLEAGSFATSYIPTTTSALTRSADVCSITGANFTNLWNTAGGTFLFEGVLPNAPNLNNRYLLSSGGTRRWAYGNSAGQGGILETIAAFDGSTTPNYFTNVRLTTKFKLAISVEALACRASFNGSTVISISHNGNLLNSVTLLALCEGGAGTITGVRYYRKNLPNAKLQAITV